MNVKRQIVWVLLTLSAYLLFGDELISKKDLGNGLTESIYLPQHIDDNFEKIHFVIKVDNAGKLLSEKIIYSLKSQKESDISCSENIYSHNDTLSQCIEIMSYEYYHKTGCNKRVKYFSNNQITNLDYFDNDTLLFSTSETTVENGYPLCKTSYLYDYLVQRKPNILLNQQTEYLVCEYGTSVFTVISEPIDLTDSDKDMLKRVSLTKHWDDLSQAFFQKIKVKSEDKEFYLILGDYFIDLLKKKGTSAVNYLACLSQDSLFLIGIHPLQ